MKLKEKDSINVIKLQRDDMFKSSSKCHHPFRTMSYNWDKLFGLKDTSQIAEEHEGFIVKERDPYTFVTKSTYKGGWNKIGMADFGTYTLPHKVEFEGLHKESMFHREGTLKYPMGHQFEGTWYKDKLIEYTYIFPDGLRYDEPWNYCKMPDRRFWSCITDGLKCVCDEQVTDYRPARKIPEGCYDTSDGFYNPQTKCVISAVDPQKVLRIPSRAEEKWIMENCRKAWDEPIGYRPDLYKQWCTGRQNEKIVIGKEVNEVELENHNYETA